MTQDPQRRQRHTGSGGNSSDKQAGWRKPSPTAEAIQAWLVSKLSEELGIEPHDIDIREPFASYALGSVQAVSLSGDLEDWLGRQLSPA